MSWEQTEKICSCPTQTLEMPNQVGSQSSSALVSWQEWDLERQGSFLRAHAQSCRHARPLWPLQVEEGFSLLPGGPQMSWPDEERNIDVETDASFSASILRAGLCTSCVRTSSDPNICLSVCPGAGPWGKPTDKQFLGRSSRKETHDKAKRKFRVDRPALANVSWGWKEA